MDITPLSLHPALLIGPNIFPDNRGLFLELYQAPLYKEIGISCAFVQDNLSFSKKGVTRGMHFQKNPGQNKLITVLSGAIYDVIVDIRPDSPTFKKWEGIYLDSEKREQLFVPVGFAHGFCVVSKEGALVLYKVSAPYNAEQEKTFRFDDPTIGIVWPEHKPILSPRDAFAAHFEQVIQ